MSNLTRTMALTLDEFYNELNCVPVSSLTGHNFDEFLKMVDTAANEFEKYDLISMKCSKINYFILLREYRVEWKKVRKEKIQLELSQLNNKLSNLEVSSGEGENINLISSLSVGREISDVYLAQMADEMSDDSDGEEIPGFNVNGKY